MSGDKMLFLHQSEEEAENAATRYIGVIIFQWFLRTVRNWHVYGIMIFGTAQSGVFTNCRNFFSTNSVHSASYLCTIKAIPVEILTRHSATE